MSSESTAVSPPTTDSKETPTFAHQTSSGVTALSTSQPAINEAPVELDGNPTSPQELEIKRRSTGQSLSNASVLSPGEEEEMLIREFEEGEKDIEGGRLREKRAQMLANRSKDPAVIVSLPNDPTADEVAAAKATEGTVTPGIPEKEAVVA